MRTSASRAMKCACATNESRLTSWNGLLQNGLQLVLAYKVLLQVRDNIGRVENQPWDANNLKL
jgi:hypothetical protein